MKKEKIQKLFLESKSKSEVCRKIGFHANGMGFKKLQKIIDKYNINTSQLSINLSNSKRKYLIIKKNCPVCDTEFETQKNHPREKTTCSCSCSNTFFRSGINNPNWKDGNGYNNIYQRLCFRNHQKECVVCGETKILDVHHFDYSHDNNSLDNLIPLCPTHHRYIHSKYKNEVENKIIEYRNKFLNNRPFSSVGQSTRLVSEMSSVRI